MNSNPDSVPSRLRDLVGNLLAALTLSLLVVGFTASHRDVVKRKGNSFRVPGMYYVLNKWQLLLEVK